MARSYTGKNTVGESRVLQKNGVIYVYERTTKYDREKKVTVMRQTPKTERLFSQVGTVVSGSTFWLRLQRNAGFNYAGVA